MGDANDNQEKLIECGLLCYVSYYQSKSSCEAIKRVVLANYTPEIISQAKDILYEAYKDKAGLPVNQNRRKHEKCVEDIYNAFKGLDEADTLKGVKFYTTNPEDLPKYNPESVSVFALMDRLQTIEQQFSDISEAVVRNTSKIADLNKPKPAWSPGQPPLIPPHLQMMSPMIGASYRPPRLPLPALSAMTHPHSRSPPTDHQSTISVDSSKDSNNQVGASAPPLTPPSGQVERVPGQRPPPTAPLPPTGTTPEQRQSQNSSLLANKIKASKPDVNDSKIPPREDKDGFRMQGDQWRKQRQKVLGKARHEKVKGAPQVKYMYISRVDTTTEDDDLKSFLQGHIRVFDLIRISSDTSFTKSYKLLMSPDDESIIMRDDFWPVGIQCQSFVFHRRGRRPRGQVRGNSR